MLRPIIHMILHFAVPLAVARFGRFKKWKEAYMIMMLTMAVDLDHLLVSPVYDPDRCGVGFHPLHSYPMIAVYVALLFMPKLRLVGLGLVIHMILDITDCVWISAYL